MADASIPPFGALQYFQSTERIGRLTHIYANEREIYFYGSVRLGQKRPFKIARPQAICGAIIHSPRYSSHPLGTMCERCETRVADDKLPYRALEAI